MTDGGNSTRIWTPANVVTLLRICLIPIFVVALLSPWPEWFGMAHAISDQTKALIAAGVFIAISCTDWIDGYLARSRNEVTDFGKLLDPLADKILVAAALIALVELRVIPSWPVLIILTREFIVSGIRMIAAAKGYVIAASWYGKAKTVLQIVAIVLFIVKDSLYLPNAASAVENPLYVISWLVMIAALAMTILSMLDYIAKARPLLFPKGEEGHDAADASEEASAADGQNAAADRQPCNSMGIGGRNLLLAGDVIRDALEDKVSIATAESLTGGGIAAALTAIPGSSACVRGGAVTYVNEVKHSVLGVGERLLEDEGAVCEEVAIEMAEGASKRFSADIAVSATGIAGPTGAEPGKPVGTVWIGVCAFGDAKAECHTFTGDREEVRAKSVEAALRAIADAMNSIPAD